MDFIIKNFKLDVVTIVLILVFLIFFVKFIFSLLNPSLVSYKNDKKTLDILTISQLCIEDDISVCYEVVPNLYKINVVSDKKQNTKTLVLTRK
jgi:hypothetical protein